MKVVIASVLLVLTIVSAMPIELDPERVVEDAEGNVYYKQLVPLRRVRRQDPGSSYIKAGGAWSSKYGGGGQIVANKNIANGKHYSVDAQAKYNQFGKHKEGWGGLVYSLRW